jgi:UDP-N-acetylmuramate dehydrogenase
MLIRENVPLAPMTTLGVGGPARFFVEARDADEACRALRWAHERGVPVFVLGGGSNLVVSDAGFKGLVLKAGIRGISTRKEAGQVFFTVGAGEDWDAFVEHAATCNCAGIECLSGIPGTVGGTPVQNVGAYGQEVSTTIDRVDALEIATGERTTFDSRRCAFGYRTSIFNTVEQGRWVILQVTFALQAGGAPVVEYEDLKEQFGKSKPTLREVREVVRQIRRHKGMLLVEGEEDCRSAGSFFKNPVLTTEQYAILQQRLGGQKLLIPAYPARESQHKVSAAWLIEKAGFGKGYVRGRVGISRKHALALVNLGNATGADVMALKTEIQSAVREQFGIDLYPEPIFLGFEETHG